MAIQVTKPKKKLKLRTDADSALSEDTVLPETSAPVQAPTAKPSYTVPVIAALLATIAFALLLVMQMMELSYY